MAFPESGDMGTLLLYAVSHSSSSSQNSNECLALEPTGIRKWARWLVLLTLVDSSSACSDNRATQAAD